MEKLKKLFKKRKKKLKERLNQKFYITVTRFVLIGPKFYKYLHKTYSSKKY